MEAALATSTTTLTASAAVLEAATNALTTIQLSTGVTVTDALKEVKIVTVAKWIAVAIN